MGYKLVPPRELYSSDIPNIVRPFVAKRILQDEFTFSRKTIFGLRDYVPAFGNKEVQQQKLIRDIENGRVVLLAMSSEFGTLGTNHVGTGKEEFDSAITRIKRSAKDRPLLGYAQESDLSASEFAGGAYMGFMSAVAEEAQETVEFVSDLVGSTVYEYTGYKGAKGAHKRTEKRIDNLIEELKHIDDLVEGVAHAVLHPVDTTAAIAENVKKGYDTVSQKLADGNNYGAGFVLGTTAKHAADLLLDSPLENLKKLKKAKKVVKAIDPEPLALPGHKGRLSARRNLSGVASTGGDLPLIKEGDRWPRGSQGNAGKVPKQVADKLAGKKFSSFNHFRKSFWTEVGNDPALSKQFNPGNRALMKRGNAPFAIPVQQVGGRATYELDHNIEIQHGGSVYDMDNIIIRTPENHIRGK